MFKENGREVPAPKEELASIKGKQMFCSSCTKIVKIENANFGNESCPLCGQALLDVEFSSADKVNGGM